MPSQPASQPATQPDLPAHALELRAEIAQLAEQLKKLTDKLAFLENAVKPADQIAAEPQNTRPTFAELTAEFGLFDVPYQKLKAENDTEKLEKLYYFEYLKRVKAIREETLRTIRDFYNEEDDSSQSAIDMWIAKNPMTPSAYFAKRKQYYRDLSRYCIDVDFIEANLADMSVDDLRENASLDLAFFEKHKIPIQAPQIFVHDVTQAQCEQYAKSDEDFLRLAYNPRAPVKFMTDNASRIDWYVASQFNSAELLDVNHDNVVHAAAMLNLNLPSTSPCGRDLQYAVMHPTMRFDALNDPFLVINYNCDWRQKLQMSKLGTFSDWKKYLFYNGTGLNYAPYVGAEPVAQPLAPTSHAVVSYTELKSEQHGGGDYYNAQKYGDIHHQTGGFQLQTIGCDRHLKLPSGAEPNTPETVNDNELLDALRDA